MTTPRNRGAPTRRRILVSDAGSSTTEMALLTPLLVMLLLFVVLCGRLVTAQQDLQAAASSAARSASLARTEATARTDAERTALATLAARHRTCQHTTVTVTTNRLQPGGAVTVTVSCTVPLADLLLLAVPGSHTVEATATSPIDEWRAAIRFKPARPRRPMQTPAAPTNDRPSPAYLGQRTLGGTP